MEALATYLIKSTVWLTGFALVYALFLRNERFFVLNRIYLISGILISIIFPFFTWHYTVLLPVVPTPEVFEPQIQGIAEASEPFPLQNVLLLSFYISGIIYLTFRILRQTLPVFRIIRKSETQHFSSAKLIRTAEYPASFSFFSFVFVNPSIDEIETNEIVNHELEHIRQQHWIDLLLFEILRTVQWFNPAIWLYGHLIRQNHEYLADERALQRSSNPAIYRAALLNQMFGGPVISLANSFNYSLNKKRFNMMKQTISSPIRKLKLLLILPLIAGVFYAFAAPEYKFIQAEELATNVIQNEKTIKGKVIDESGKPLKSASVVILGKTIGTITDENGNFVLKVTDDSPIMISYVGFESVK
ncbi:MAG: carboxypeptidase-like regulatory domain-containing protein, partial [Bacteroidota bacterium]|nr:carboxypeptidase-like regulatory domain-containing protein [Bacteroidota bacterium]